MPHTPNPPPIPSLDKRLDLLHCTAEKFFEGSAWLAGTTGLPGVVVAAAAGLTLLVVDQAKARWEAILERPIGAPDAEYSVPDPAETLAWFRDRPDPPELAVQFAAELAAHDWRTLQKAHRALYEVLVFRDPALRGAFAFELSRADYAGIVRYFEPVRLALGRLSVAPETRSILKHWHETLSGQGPAADDAEARATFEAHWRDLVHAIRQAES